MSFERNNEEFDEIAREPTFRERFVAKWKEVPVGYRIVAPLLFVASVATLLLIFFPIIPGADAFFATTEILGIALLGASIGEILLVAAAVVGAISLLGHLAQIALADDDYIPPVVEKIRPIVKNVAQADNSAESALQEEHAEQREAYINISEPLPEGAPPLLSSAAKSGLSYVPQEVPTTVAVAAPAQKKPLQDVGSDRPQSRNEELYADAIRKGFPADKPKDVKAEPAAPKKPLAPPPLLSAIAQMTKEDQAARLAEIAARQAGESADASPPVQVDAAPKV